MIVQVLLNKLQKVGISFLELCHKVYAFVAFAFDATMSIFSKPFYGSNFVRELISFGYYSIPIIALNSLFIGGVLVLQTYVTLTRFGVTDSIPSIVSLSITRELAPVLTGLMFTSRVGASIAAEIGFMKVSEQIDALYTLGAKPIKYLVSLKVLVSIIVMPFLVLISDIIGIFGGYIVAISQFDFDSVMYVRKTVLFLKANDIISGLIKALFFGYVVSLVSCYNGYNASKGAYGVGRSTTKAVVNSSITVLLLNYIITKIIVI